MNPSASRFEIVKQFRFEAAHRLSSDTNIEPYQRIHGHSFRAEVALSGEPDPKTGWVVDFAVLEASLDRLRAQLDHCLLNEIAGLETPTLEHLCLWIWRALVAEWSMLRRVSVFRDSCGEACHFCGNVE